MLSWKEHRSICPLARSLFLLQLTDTELHLSLHNTSRQSMLILLLFRYFHGFQVKPGQGYASSKALLDIV